MLLNYGTRVPLTESIEKPHRTSVDWESFDASLLARIRTNGFKTPLELSQNVMYDVVFVRHTFQAEIRIVKICIYQEYNTNHDTATANRLLEELDNQRKQK
jgi:hypothetical protein